jgi:hypothetical protein
MPFKSKAQRRKFAQLLVEGKITDEAYERWNQETGRAELPERVTSSETSGRAKRPRKPAAGRKQGARKAPAARKSTAKRRSGEP